MRLIHTADWHVGLISWRGSKITDRSMEIERVLEELVQKVELLHPDVITVAGDVIHNKRSPNLRTLEIVLRTLEALANIAPTVVVLGNHDWEGLVTYNKLSEDLLIIGLGDYRRRILETNHGKLAIYPLPYVSGAMMLAFGRERVLKSLISKLREFDVDNPNADYKILISHMMFKGAVRPVEDLVSIELDESYIGSTFSYVALGHVHRFQRIMTNPLAYYSGSVIQVDFSENEDKGFLVVDIDGWNVNAEFSKLPHKRLTTLYLEDKDEKEIFRKIEEFSEKFDYMRVVISSRNFDMTRKLMKIPKVVSVKVHNDENYPPRIESFEDIDEVFLEYMREALKSKLPDEKFKRGMEIFRNVLKSVTA